MSTTRAALAVLLVLAGSACGGNDDEHAPAERSPATRASVPAFPTQWADTIDNPWLPLVPGTRWVYDVTGDEGAQQDVVTVTGRQKEVAGVTATVVHDRITWADTGEVAEDTYDWYAQDLDGNVWYLGEDTTAYEHGKADTAGSWEAGVDGAEAGIIVPADPQPGDSYQQEYYAGEAEDRGRVLSLDATVSVPAGDWTGVLQTEDTTPLEPDLVEHKFYARGVGVVEERDVAGGDEHVVLVELVQPRSQGS